MHTRERGLAVLARWPEPGRVLPRLTARLGLEAAAEVYEAFLGDLATALPRGAFDTRLYCLDEEDAFRGLFPGLTVRPQRGRFEGRRLHACFKDMFASYRRVVVMSSQVPDLHPRLLQSAFEMLERRDAVVGPTERGGAYLLGLRAPRDVFKDVPWGTSGELDALLRNLSRAGLNTGFFPARQKVETLDDLVMLRRRLPPSAAPRTYQALCSFGVGDETRNAS
jgi:glycosyltransferase A (GT-A) superfamily protein (DUF2064 family)